MNEKYELRRELGEGKTSKVYLANDVNNSAQKYAIKILKNDYIENDEKAQDQVIKEVAVLETLKHKGIVGIFDYGDDGREAVRLMLDEGFRAGLIPGPVQPDFSA